MRRRFGQGILGMSVYLHSEIGDHDGNRGAFVFWCAGDTPEGHESPLRTNFGKDVVSLPILWYNGEGDDRGQRKRIAATEKESVATL
jgi:hypothetical protein